MKKILSVILAMTLILGLFAGTAFAEDPVKVGICCASWMSNTVFVDASKQMNAWAKENNVQLLEKDLTTDTIINSLETFISAGCDVVIVQANQAPEAVASMFPRFIEAGIPLCIYDTDAYKDEEAVIYSLSLSNYDAGYMLGEYVAKWANENIEGHVYAGVINRESNETFRFRAVGIEDALKEHLNDGAVYGSFESLPGTSEGGMKAAEDLLSAIPNMNLCVAWNGGSGVGAYEALKAAGWDGVGEALFTIDASVEELKAMAEGGCLLGSMDPDVVPELIKLLQKGVAYVREGGYPEGFDKAESNWYFNPVILDYDAAMAKLNG